MWVGSSPSRPVDVGDQTETKESKKIIDGLTVGLIRRVDTSSYLVLLDEVKVFGKRLRHTGPGLVSDRGTTSRRGPRPQLMTCLIR